MQSKCKFGNQIKDLNLNLKTSPLIKVDENYNTDSYLLHSVGEKLYLVTNSNAPNQKLIVVNARKPQEKYWKDFIPEGKYVLSPTVGGGYFFAQNCSGSPLYLSIRRPRRHFERQKTRKARAFPDAAGRGPGARRGASPRSGRARKS